MGMFVHPHFLVGFHMVHTRNLVKQAFVVIMGGESACFWPCLVWLHLDKYFQVRKF